MNKELKKAILNAVMSVLKLLEEKFNKMTNKEEV